MITKHKTPKLLVSVRDKREASLVLEKALECECLRLIDVKEPNKGPLGQVDADRLIEIGKVFSEHKALHGDYQIGSSVALGEVNELKTNSRVFGDEDVLRDFQFAKMGLSDLGNQPGWWQKWKKLLTLLPPKTNFVAVAYADYYLCHSPNPFEVAKVGQQLGCHYVLLDTYTKDGSSLFDFMPAAKVHEFVSTCKNASQIATIAGSLGIDSMRSAIQCNPDFIGVRGAVCESDRASSISPKQINRIARFFVNVQFEFTS